MRSNSGCHGGPPHAQHTRARPPRPTPSRFIYDGSSCHIPYTLYLYAGVMLSSPMRAPLVSTPLATAPILSFRVPNRAHPTLFWPLASLSCSSCLDRRTHNNPFALLTRISTSLSHSLYPHPTVVLLPVGVVAHLWSAAGRGSSGIASSYARTERGVASGGSTFTHTQTHSNPNHALSRESVCKTTTFTHSH